MKVKIIVKGMVQGVGYRYFCYRKAIEYSVCGYARNLSDGSVEIEAMGNQKMISDFIKQLKIGPIGSNVKSLIIEEFESKNHYDDFRIF